MVRNSVDSFYKLFFSVCGSCFDKGITHHQVTILAFFVRSTMTETRSDSVRGARDSGCLSDHKDWSSIALTLTISLVGFEVYSCSFVGMGQPCCVVFAHDGLVCVQEIPFMPRWLLSPQLRDPLLWCEPPLRCPQPFRSYLIHRVAHRGRDMRTRGGRGFGLQEMSRHVSWGESRVGTSDTCSEDKKITNNWSLLAACRSFRWIFFSTLACSSFNEM